MPLRRENRHNIDLDPGRRMDGEARFVLYLSTYIQSLTHIGTYTHTHTKHRSEKPALETSCGTRVRLRISTYATSFPRYISTP